jgi:hypothetical protein
MLPFDAPYGPENWSSGELLHESVNKTWFAVYPPVLHICRAKVTIFAAFTCVMFALPIAVFVIVNFGGPGVLTGFKLKPWLKNMNWHASLEAPVVLNDMGMILCPVAGFHIYFPHMEPVSDMALPHELAPV